MDTHINNKNYLQDTNYDNDEFIYSLDNDDPMIMPGLITCTNCGADVKPECEESGCKHCGYRVKLNGYPKHNYGSGEFVDNNGSEDIEHFDSGTAVTMSFICNWVCWVLIAFFVAHMRGELKNGIAVILCIIVFPQFYLSFALVDWIVFGYSKKVANM